VGSFDADEEINEQEMERLVKQAFVNDDVGWDELSLKEKMQLFNKWSVVTLIGNLFTIFGSSFYIFSRFFNSKLIEIFIGFGCFFSWVSIIRYLENTRQFSVITRTFSVAIPKVAALQFGILPVYVGYTLMGRALFWQDLHAFMDFSKAAFTLFSVANGDSVWDTFSGTTRSRYIVGFLYSLAWTFFGVIIMQNMNLVVIEDTYLTVKYKSNNEWLEEDEQPSP
jgi:hypothetical protein